MTPRPVHGMLLLACYALLSLELHVGVGIAQSHGKRTLLRLTSSVLGLAAFAGVVSTVSPPSFMGISQEWCSSSIQLTVGYQAMGLTVGLQYSDRLGHYSPSIDLVRVGYVLLFLLAPHSPQDIRADKSAFRQGWMIHLLATIGCLHATVASFGIDDGGCNLLDGFGEEGRIALPCDHDVDEPLREKYEYRRPRAS